MRNALMNHFILNRLQQRKHLVLLLTLVSTILVQPLARGFLAGLIIYDILRSLIVVIVFFVVFQRRRDRLIALVIALPVLAGSWALHIVPARFEMLLWVRCIMVFSWRSLALRLRLFCAAFSSTRWSGLTMS